MTKIFKTPFGALGDKQEVPTPTQSDGSVSYEQGFGIDYQRDYEDPQAKDIPREGLNQLFYDVTKALGELQKLGYMQWQAGQYQAGDRVAEGGVAYKAVRATSNKPPHNDWAAITEGGPFVTESGDQNVSGIKKFTSFPVTPSAAPTVNYQVANKKYVDDNALGVGQTWQDVTASRSEGTTYTNTTGKPIYISAVVSAVAPGSAVAFQLLVDQHLISQQVVVGGTSTVAYSGSSTIVPSGSTYRLYLSQGNLSVWVELR